MFVEPIVEPVTEPALETVTNEIDLRDDSIVLTKDFIKEYCETFDTFSISHFNACVNYANVEILVAFFSLLFGLLVGFILAKAVADGWI